MTGSMHRARLDDYVVMGRYVIWVCVLAELSIMSQVQSMFYMMYAGAAPPVNSCGSTLFDPELEDKEACLAWMQMGDNCTSPSLKYQFKSVNVECELLLIQLLNVVVLLLRCKDGEEQYLGSDVGVLVGSVVFGQLSDSFGRKKSMILTMLGMSVGWLIVSMSRDLTQFTATRTIVGFFTGGSISVLNVYIMENIPKQHRMWINMAITWSPNMPPLALIAYLCHTWKTMALVNGVMCLPALIFTIFFVHESPRWLVTKGRVDEAREVIRKQLKTSNQLSMMDDNFENVLMEEYSLSQQINAKKRQYSYYHLFSTGRLALTTTVLAFSYFSTSIINYGILFNMEKLSGSIYWNSVYTGVMRYCCNLSFGYADLRFKRIGRKFIHTAGLVVIILSLGLVVFAYFFDLNHLLRKEISIAILLASSMTSQVYIADGIVGNELFPTPIRNLGYSFLQLWNRVGVIVSPFVFYLQDWWIALPYCVMLLFSTMDTVAFECCLPETKGKPLIEHMPRKDERIFARKRRAAKSDALIDSSAADGNTVLV